MVKHHGKDEGLPELRRVATAELAKFAVQLPKAVEEMAIVEERVQKEELFDEPELLEEIIISWRGILDVGERRLRGIMVLQQLFPELLFVYYWVDGTLRVI